jgi:transcriptional regulator with XRE-family HTH domain
MPDDNDLRHRIRDFMVTRRERVAPGDVGIHVGSAGRRVKGLRREEVAMLAGVSVEYYTRFERGDAVGASNEVVAAVSSVLRLDDVERAHLRRMYATLGAGRRAQPIRVVESVRPTIQRILDAMETIPAFAVNRRNDIIATNLLGRAFFGPMLGGQRLPVNQSRWQFLDQTASRAFWVDWEVIADNGVDLLRTELGTGPDVPELNELIAELLTVPEFAERWSRHNVRRHVTGVKRIDHPIVGRMDLTYENMHLADGEDLSILTFNPEPGTRDDDAMRLLGIWAREHADEASESAV